MRTNRSEFEAGEALASGAVQRIARSLDREATRREWREVLAERDAKRAHRSRRDARRNTVGRASLVGMLQAFAVACAAIVARWS